ncbi:MAG: hypothetical protein KW802_03235 [Candidatus Doudnabacteria bacterium]|nr:hypothetical protein [Candidatus Doudnabacteria bacterium]
MKINFTKLIAVLVLSNVLLVNFAFAQTTAPAKNTTITKADIMKSQTDLAGCTVFRKQIQDASSNQLKAVWYDHDKSETTSRGCYIVGGTFADNDKVDISTQAAFVQPQQYKLIQDTLYAEGAIKADQVAIAQIKDLEEQSKANVASQILGWFINSIFTVVTAAVSVLTAIAGEIFSKVVENILNISSMPPIVDLGWSIVRDFANMFFILILIVIALAAILRIESYDYRHLLAEVVMMALLVNFSKVIAVSLLNFVNAIVAIFALDGLRDVAGFIFNYVRPAEIFSLAGSGWMSALVQGISKLIFSLVALSAFLALAGLFVVRLVGIYVLVILSPMAYVLDILPATKHFAHEWWQAFVKYLVWAPVAMFFVRLTIWLAKNGLQGFGSGNNSAFNYIILMAFMWASVIVAEHAGMVGGNAIINTAEKAGHGLGHWMGHSAGGRVARTWNDFTSHMYAKNPDSRIRKTAFAVLNPVAAGKAWSERSHEKTHIAQSYALATGKEIFGGKIGTPYRANLARQEEMNYAKEYLNMTKEQKAVAAQQLETAKGHEAAVRRRALLRSAAEDNHIEDIMASGHFVERYTDAEGKINRESINRFLHDFTNAEHDTESQRFIASDMNSIGTKTRRFDYTGHGIINPESGEYSRGFKSTGRKIANIYGNTIDEMVDNGQADYAATELGKLDGQERIRVSPQNFVTIQTDVKVDPTTGKKVISQRWVYTRDKYSEAMLSKMDEGSRRDLHRAQGRTIEAFIPGRVDKDGSIIVNNLDEMQAIKEFYEVNRDHAKAMYARKLGVDDPQKQIGKIHGIKIKMEGGEARVRNPDGSTHVMRVADEVLDHPELFEYDPEHKKINDKST